MFISNKLDTHTRHAHIWHWAKNACRDYQVQRLQPALLVHCFFFSSSWVSEKEKSTLASYGALYMERNSQHVNLIFYSPRLNCTARIINVNGFSRTYVCFSATTHIRLDTSIAQYRLVRHCSWQLLSYLFCNHCCCF